MSKDNLRDGRVKNWFYLENDLLDRGDLTIYEKMIYIVIARYVDKEDKAFPSVPTIARPKDSGNDKNTDPKGKYYKNRVVVEYHGPNRYKSREKELLAKEIAEKLNDNHSLGAFRVVVDKISEQRIRIFLSIIKDTYLTGRIKKSRGAMFISLAKVYAGKNNINLNFR